MARDDGPVNVDDYLERIGFDREAGVDLGTLERLQRMHLTAVPFENLDVWHGRRVETGLDWSIPKIIDRNRGGWCFELNGAFAALLEALGFQVKRLAATVLLGNNVSPEPDHLTIEVLLDRPYLVDVGFGDSFIKPLPLDSEGPHDGGVGPFAFRVDHDDVTLVALTNGSEDQYRFNRTPIEMSVFDASNHRLQTEPGISLTSRPFATRLIDGGPDRVTLLADRIKFRRNGAWKEELVAESQWTEHLERYFSIAP